MRRLSSISVPRPHPSLLLSSHLQALLLLQYHLTSSIEKIRSYTPPPPSPHTHTQPSKVMTQSDNGVYVNGDFSEPMSSQHDFAQAYDMDNPQTAMWDYSRVMHKHTKRQLELATTSARRRSSPTTLSPTESQSSTESVSTPES